MSTLLLWHPSTQNTEASVMGHRFLAVYGVTLLLAGCAADPPAPAVQSNFVPSYWFQDRDPARSAERPPTR